jgi:hypothetical protein|tara:strand:+ start:1276 stop:2505 length:1230 start_codon:yes stop_codon:yes gene_type:complete
MADVSGTINVEVIYKEAGGSGASASDITGGGGGGSASGSAAAADKKKNSGFLSEMSKFAKVTAASLTVGAAIKNSKVMSGFLGTMSQLLGALVDVFLMPFIPLLIPVMKVMAGLIKWLVKFMEDPMGALKEAWGNISNFVMNDLKEFGKSLFTVTFWKELWGDINWEQILKMGVGGAGLVGLVAALSGGISLAMAAPGFITRLVTGLIPGMGGGKGAAGNLLGGCCGPGAGGALTKGAKGAGAAGIGVRILSAVPIALAAGALAGVIIGGDGLPGPIKEIQEEFHKWLPQQSQHIQDAIKQQLYYTGLNLKEQTEYMKSTLDAQKTAKGDATYQEIAEHGSRTGPGWSQTPGGPNAWLDSVMNQNDMNVTIEIIPPAGTGIYTSGTEDGYSYKVDVVTARENQKWSLEG